MARTRIHVRLVMLGGVVAGALTGVWALGFTIGGAGAHGVLLVALVLGPAAGILAALAATWLAGHPAGTADDDPPTPADSARTAVPACGAR